MKNNPHSHGTDAPERPRLLLALDRMIESVEHDMSKEDKSSEAWAVLGGELKGLMAARTYAEQDMARVPETRTPSEREQIRNAALEEAAKVCKRWNTADACYSAILALKDTATQAQMTDPARTDKGDAIPTPRTDAAWWAEWEAERDSGGKSSPAQGMCDLACQLERELAEAITAHAKFIGEVEKRLVLAERSVPSASRQTTSGLTIATDAAVAKMLEILADHRLHYNDQEQAFKMVKALLDDRNMWLNDAAKQNSNLGRVIAERDARAREACTFEKRTTCSFASQTPPEGRANLPPMDEDLGDILGRPNFTCVSIANLLRFNGLTVKKKAEDEQAACIYFLLDLYLKHGKEWRGVADKTLGEIHDRWKASECSGPLHSSTDERRNDRGGAPYPEDPC